MCARLLAVTFDLLPPTLVTSPSHATPLLGWCRRCLVDVGAVILPLLSLDRGGPCAVVGRELLVRRIGRRPLRLIFGSGLVRREVWVHRINGNEVHLASGGHLPALGCGQRCDCRGCALRRSNCHFPARLCLSQSLVVLSRPGLDNPFSNDKDKDTQLMSWLPSEAEEAVEGVQDYQFLCGESLAAK